MIFEMYTPISQKISKGGSPGSSAGKDSAWNTGDFLGQEYPLEKG